ncbi:MAG: hypothetical protein FGM32_01310 [Candidatus Kapabacteria bacterium]|nr:hypothetical protein [Candidatus Kapabacteria bacterium]
MTSAARSSLESAQPILIGLSAATLLLVVVTGMLLSMWYVPSSDPLRTSTGAAQTIVTSTRLLHSGPYTDTITASSVNPQLAPASTGEPAVSAAQSSIRVTIHNAPYGSAVRSIHHWMSDILLALLTTLMSVLCVLRTYEADRSLWLRLISLTLITVAGGWTGRILVDDVYAEISRRIMGYELQTAPLGNAISAILGIQPGALLLARTYSVHGFMLGVIGLLLITPNLRQILVQASRPPFFSTALLVSVAVSFISVPDWGLRDALRGLAGWEHVTPWWGIVPFRTWSHWLGSELAGYLAIPAIIAFGSLPLWYRQISKRAVTILFTVIALALLVGFLFGY